MNRARTAIIYNQLVALQCNLENLIDRQRSDKLSTFIQFRPTLNDCLTQTLRRGADRANCGTIGGKPRGSITRRRLWTDNKPVQAWEWRGGNQQSKPSSVPVVRENLRLLLGDREHKVFVVAPFDAQNRIVAALDAGTPPWIKPWTAGTDSGLPVNAGTQRAYRGVNLSVVCDQLPIVLGQAGNQFGFGHAGEKTRKRWRPRTNALLDVQYIPRRAIRAKCRDGARLDAARSLPGI